MYHLTVQNGSSRGTAWELEEGVTLLGRSAECAVRIPNDTAVSRVHGELRVEGKAVAFKQLSGRSVTLLNGKVVQEAALHPGDTLTVGLTTLLFARSTAETGAPAAALITRTVSEADAVFLGGRQAEKALSERVESLRDLAELFRLSTAFNQAENPGDLLVVLADALRERFAPAGGWIVHTQPGAESAEVAPLPGLGQGSAPPWVGEALEHARVTGEGALIPRSAGGSQAVYQTALVAPLRSGGHAFGAVALVNGPENGPYEEHDLQFVVALCRSAAPCLISVGRLVELRHEVARLRSGGAELSGLLGDSAAMVDVRRQLRQAAGARLNILILGESGTGKELAARVTHTCADFSDGPYVVVNCAAIPADMLESELFGYKSGAFTGASGAREGLIARADGGTLFLDEVGDLSPENQARVLRVLETGSYRPLGSDEERTSDFRVVSATNKDIPELVASGAFRADLYHRLNGFEIVLPPLRAHPEDIPALARHFFQQAMARAKRPLKGIEPDALAQLQRAPWPGNARQLRNTVERSIAIARDDYIAAADFGMMGDAVYEAGQQEPLSLVDAEKRHIAHVVEKYGGDASEAARRLGLSRSTYYEKLKKHGITPPSCRNS